MIFIRTVLPIFFIAFPFINVRADYISLIRADQCETIVEIFVEKDEIRVSLEIGEQDYPFFKWIIPEDYFTHGFNENNKEDYLFRFFSESFIITTDGVRLKGELITIKRIQRN